MTKAESLNVACVFHLIVIFLGSVGAVMCSSGLTEALECCYGPNTVVQMMHGIAVARSLRVHFMVDSALWIFVAADIAGLGQCVTHWVTNTCRYF